MYKYFKYGDLGLTLKTALNKSGGTVSLAANSYNTSALSTTVTASDLGLTLISALSKSGGTVSLAANSYCTSTLSMTVDRSDLGLTDKAAATYNPSTSDQTIGSGYYLTGAQTIKGITAITNSTYAGYLTSSTTARTTTIKTISGPITADIYIYPSTSIYNIGQIHMVYRIVNLLKWHCQVLHQLLLVEHKKQ